MATSGAIASVLYDYTAQNENELSIRAGTFVTIVTAPEGKKWWKVQNTTKQAGFVPANYLNVSVTGTGGGGASEPAKAVAPALPESSPLSREPSRSRLSRESAGAAGGATASSPLSSQRGLVIYPYAAARPDELSVEPGMTVKVLEESDDGWMMCVGPGGAEGWLPKTYVDLTEAGEDAPSGEAVPERKAATARKIFVALYPFKSGRPNELTIATGERFVLLDRPDADWAHVKRLTDKAIGYVPANYIEEEADRYTAVGEDPESPASYDLTADTVGDFEAGRAPYFHGTLPRATAESMLASAPLGTFLVRESETMPGSYSVTVNAGQNAMHFKIMTNGAQYVIGERSFPTMDDLVAFYNDYPIFTSNGVRICLKFPAKKLA
eukprot:m.179492 g.179492  ORF g.179492 m.179492 type:complete len:381 (+) comp14773_c0_seq1:88-1230(+)